MPIPWPALVASLAAVMALMVGLWLVSLPLRNASIVDIFWGPGFVVAAAAAMAAVGSPWARGWLALALVMIWAARLAIHILLRNRGKGEDFRYRAWREGAGPRFAWVSLFQVFLLQGVLLWVISHPVQAAATRGGGLTWLDAMAVVAWAVGFIFEAVGDQQLVQFKAAPANRGRVLRTGLWAWSRHPNYFGDALQWWAFYLFALGVPGGWVTVYSPILMTILLLRVSGVGLLERKLVETKPGYRAYVRQVSAFIPWFPRRTKA